jgi:hypothetical protein
VLSIARRDVRAFMLHPDARHKERCPNLGLLLVEYLLVAKEDAPWSRFGPALLRECLARHVMWAVRSNRDFGLVGREQASRQGDSRDDFCRLKGHFEAAEVSLRLLTLQVGSSASLITALSLSVPAPPPSPSCTLCLAP